MGVFFVVGTFRAFGKLHWVNSDYVLSNVIKKKIAIAILVNTLPL